jgi:hypothetical protein
MKAGFAGRQIFERCRCRGAAADDMFDSAAARFNDTKRTRDL